MKLIIAGSRDLNQVNSTFIIKTMVKYDISYTDIEEIVSGCSGIVDQAGIEWAARLSRTLKPFHAEWDTFGNAAGPVRNRKMADYADALLVIWDGESRGSYNMISEMQLKNKPIYEVVIPKPIYKKYNMENSE